MEQGRPATWTDPEAFAKAVDEYFSVTDKPRTWTGLALHLGFESRQSLQDYKDKEGFSYPIKRALLRIEEIYEGKLSGTTPTGSIFALKNFGWIDKTEVKHDGIPETSVSPTINVYNSAPPLAESEDKV